MIQKQDEHPSSNEIEDLRVIFISHYPELYGANRSLLNLIDGLGAYGVQAAVVCPGAGPITEELTRRGVPFWIYPVKWWFSAPQPRHRLNGLLRFLATRRSLPALKKLVSPWRPDLIYTNSSVTPVGALLARSLGKPHVWHIREFGLQDYGLQKDVGEAFFRFWLNRAAGVIAISKAVREEVLRGVRSRVHVIYNGVTSATALQRLAKDEVGETPKNGNFVFAIVGLIHPSKGQKEAIEAIALVHRNHRRVELRIAGTGDDAFVKQLRVLASDLGIAPQIRFLGFVDDIFPVYRAADAVLMCSRFEAMGRVTAEAMAAGKPVIGHNSAGTGEIVDHGSTGLLYERAPDDLAACMRRLIEDPEFTLALGRNARKKAREEFTVEAYAAKVFKVLQSIAGSGKE